MISYININDKCNLLLFYHTTTPVDGLFSRTTWASRYQKGKTSLDLNEARDGGVWRWWWHQLDHMQTICTSLRQITTPTVPPPHQSIFTGEMLFLMPKQQSQSTEGNLRIINT